MPDLGAPASYLVLPEGAPVYARGGEGLGTVKHVLAEPDADVFDGIVLDADEPAGLRFADASQVDEIYERGVVLVIDADAVGWLPEPSENPVAMAAGPDETVPDDLGDKLRRAWDRISGNY
jgi:hypothetical protein